MAIGFEEIRKYIARDVRISVCFQDGYYHNYLMISDIPEHKYDGLYVYGIGMVNVEFSRDVYSVPKEQEGIIRGTKDDIPGEYDTCLKKRMVVVLSKDDLKTKETKM